MTLAVPPDAPASGFVDFLQRLEYGKLLDETDDALVNLLRELVKAAERGAKPKGGLTLKITLDYDEDGLLHVKGDLAITKPRYPRRNTVLFCDGQGNIVGTAPKQLSIFSDPDARADRVTMAEPAVVVFAAADAAPVAVAVADAFEAPYPPAPRTPDDDMPLPEPARAMRVV